MTEKQSIERVLREQGVLVYPNVGNSMMPLLKQGRDLMEIRAKGPERCRRYDAVLYRRGDHYILHRIIRVRENDYVIVGDNCWHCEYGITDDQILGVLKSVRHKGRRIGVDELGYRLYVHLWCDLFPLRAAILWSRDGLLRMKHALGNLLRWLGLR